MGRDTITLTPGHVRGDEKTYPAGGDPFFSQGESSEKKIPGAAGQVVPPGPPEVVPPGRVSHN
jgi:hypothetical protein